MSIFVDKRIFSDNNVNKFKDQLASIHFDSILHMNDPDMVNNHFKSIYSNLFQIVFLITRLKLNKISHTLEPWTCVIYENKNSTSIEKEN